ncbi:hypothetical protein [Streptosporangium roseum]|uniref:hypothetical protein n=1 Tax=Streptosporangium roseum TaxID=2001 RepID=UPI00332C88F7
MTRKARKTGRFKRFVSFAVTIGAMTLSVAGVSEAIGGGNGAILFPLVMDAAALVSLDTALTAPKKSSLRRWSWAIVILSGGISMSLNVWHALVILKLPEGIAYVYGAGPILLSMGTSHVIALGMTGHGDEDDKTPSVTPPAVTTTPNPSRRNPAPRRPAVTPAAPVASPAVTPPAPVTPPAVTPAVPVVPAPSPRPRPALSPPPGDDNPKGDKPRRPAPSPQQDGQGDTPPKLTKDQRILRLQELLTANPQATNEELAADVAVSVRQVQRDINDNGLRPVTPGDDTGPRAVTPDRDTTTPATDDTVTVTPPPHDTWTTVAVAEEPMTPRPVTHALSPLHPDDTPAMSSN